MYSNLQYYDSVEIVAFHFAPGRYFYNNANVLNVACVIETDC